VAGLGRTLSRAEALRAFIATFAEVESEDEARAWKPTVVHVDAQNRIVPIAGEVPGPQRRLWPV
jgi:aspartate 1-decarboxylase